MSAQPLRDGRGTEPRARDAAAQGRKTYIAPSFRHEQVFETMALNCSKTAIVHSCNINHPKKSS